MTGEGARASNMTGEGARASNMTGEGARASKLDMFRQRRASNGEAGEFCTPPSRRAAMTEKTHTTKNMNP